MSELWSDVTLTLRTEHRRGPIARARVTLQKQRGVGWGRNAQYQEAERAYCLQQVKKGDQQDMAQLKEWLARLRFRDNRIQVLISA